MYGLYHAYSIKHKEILDKYIENMANEEQYVQPEN